MKRKLLTTCGTILLVLLVMATGRAQMSQTPPPSSAPPQSSAPSGQLPTGQLPGAGAPGCSCGELGGRVVPRPLSEVGAHIACISGRVRQPAAKAILCLGEELADVLRV